MITCSVNIEGPGEADLVEAGEQLGYEGYDSKKLAGVEVGDMAFSVQYNRDEKDTGSDIWLNMHAHHVENPVTKRAFHARLESRLTWEDVERLRNFFNFLLSLRSQHEMAAGRRPSDGDGSAAVARTAPPADVQAAGTRFRKAISGSRRVQGILT